MAVNPNLYADEESILARLRAALPAECRVDSLSVLVGQRDLSAYCPGAYLSAAGVAIGDKALRGRVGRADTSWEVTLFVAHHDHQDTLTATRAGALLARVLDALVGWSPDGGPVGFDLESLSAPAYLIGRAEFGAVFRLSRIFKAA